MTSTQLAEKAARLAWEKKGDHIVILDVRKLTDMTDYFIVVSGESDTHVKAISDFIEESLETEGESAWHREGYEKLNWVLLDYIEVVIHIFRPRTREFYALEKLWGDARKIEVEEDVPDRILLEE
ncbi:MAG: ribosome silencing factor [Calditrichia bacterium]